MKIKKYSKSAGWQVRDIPAQTPQDALKEACEQIQSAEAWGILERIEAGENLSDEDAAWLYSDIYGREQELILE